MNPWPVIRAALMRYRVSALAFILLVAAGVALTVAILSQERALRSGSARAADRFALIVAPPGSRTDALFTGVFLRPGASQLLSPTLTAKLLNDPRAAFVSPLAFGDSHRGAPVVGVVSALVEHLSAGLAQGRVFNTWEEAVVGLTRRCRSATGSNLRMAFIGMARLIVLKVMALQVMALQVMAVRAIEVKAIEVKSIAAAPMHMRLR